MNVPFVPDYRISDNERQKAIELLAEHFAAGRLTLEEYDQRVANVAAATMNSEIIPLFNDLPANVANGPIAASEPMYTASEINSLRNKGQSIRGGIFGISSIVLLTLQAGLGPIMNIPIFTMMIPIIAILLYVIQIGPKSWYAPSARQLAKQRRREMLAAELEQRRAIEMNQSLKKAEQQQLRQQHVAQMSQLALDAANEAMNRWKNRR